MKFKFICSIVLCIIISILLSSCASIPINNNLSLTKEGDYLIDAGNRNVVNSPVKENQNDPTDNQKENVENEVGQTEPTDSDDIGPSDPNDPQATECPSFEDVPSDNDENGDSLKHQIKLAYAEYLNAKDNTYLQARDIEIGRYFGNYLGCEIVLIGVRDGEARGVGQEWIGRNLFSYSDSKRIYVYKDQKIYSIREAYDLKLIDLATVIQVSNEQTGLTSEVELELKEAYRKDFPNTRFTRKIRVYTNITETLTAVMP